ncbi:MFS transporter [Burkholderia sp. SG-MS1]|uniref:MFS transporter n=1 Tax=Paraburkholderia sp. SG-MS1 TaxID=2023741 RepID=UPI001444E2E1|nr:MFS transporter [Paraburkholderia sp. SG-MS1]NKJ50676.1 MFS transporter [Paraburkholderia sp. SG-MS1]
MDNGVFTRAESLNSAQEARNNDIRTIAACSIGNALEVYDFTVYSFFAVLIGKLFFPSSNAYGSLMLAVATFGIGFILRPLGAFVIGSYADRRGRKRAMTLTISVMVAGTLCIACAPTYESVGIAGPLIVLAGRMLQGFSLGGEIGPSTSLLMEAGEVQSRGFRISWQAASQGMAALLGALSGAVLYATLSPDSIEAWGWRIPFLLGLLIAPVGLYIRSQLDETHNPERYDLSPIRTLFSQHFGSLIKGVLAITAGTVGTYVVVFFMPTYMIRVLHMPPSLSLLSGCVSGATMLIVSLIAGRLTDRLVLRKPLIQTALVLTAAATYPAYELVNHSPSLFLVLAMTSLLTALLYVVAIPVLVLLTEILPSSVRASGLSIMCSIAVMAFGGSAQYVVTWLLAKTGNPMAPAFYLIASCVVAFIAVSTIRESKHYRPA